MSGRNFGDGDRPKERKVIVTSVEGATVVAATTRFSDQVTPAAISHHTELIKSGLQVALKPSLNRAIAPAPAQALATGPLTAAVSVSGAKILAQPSQHNLVPKAVGGVTLDHSAMLQQAASSQALAVNLSTPGSVAAAAAATHSTLHIAMTTTVPSSLHPVALPPGGFSLAQAGAPGLVAGHTFPAQVREVTAKDKEEGREKASRVTVMAPVGLHDHQDRLRPTMQMASLIRGSLPQQAQVSLSMSQGIPVAQALPTATQSSIIHTVPSHVPRGAAAASALTAPKTGAVATPILRHTHPAGLNALSVTSPAPLIQAQMQPRAILPVRPGTPPVPSMAAAMQATQVEVQRSLTGHPGASVHLTTRVLTEIPGRPMLSHATTKVGGVSLAQSVLQHAGVAFTSPQHQQAGQKVVLPQQAGVPHLLTPTSAPTMVTMAGPRLAGLNLTQPITRVQKIITTQAGNLATPVNFESLGMPRHQKVVVTTTAPNLPTVVHTMAAKGAIPGTAVNLNHNLHQRQQKLVPSPAGLPITIAALPKPVVGMGAAAVAAAAAAAAGGPTHPSPLSHVITMPPTAPMTVQAAATSTIPIATVNPQRQIFTPAQHHQLQQHLGHPVGLATAHPSGQPQPTPQPQQHAQPQQPHAHPQPPGAAAAAGAGLPLGVGKVTTAVATPIPIPVPSAAQLTANLFAQAAAQRASPLASHPQVTGAPGPTPGVAQTLAHTQGPSAPGLLPTSVSVTAASQQGGDNRPQGQDRAPGLPHYPFAIPPDFSALISASSLNASSIVSLPFYQQGQTFNSTSGMRHAIVPGQASGLSAALQAAQPHTPVSVGAGATQPGLGRAPPVRVSVEPSRHMQTHAHFAAAQVSEGASVPGGAVAAVGVAPPGGAQGGAAVAQHVPAPVVTAALGPPPPNNAPNNQTSSPRPTILRKRPGYEGTQVTLVKRNLANVAAAAEMANSGAASDMSLASHVTSSPKPMPCDPSRENSQSSTDTASSAESTPQNLGMNDSSVKVKEEPPDSAETGAASALSAFSSISASMDTASPRKKPRKQLLLLNEDVKEEDSSGEELETLARQALKREERERQEAEEAAEEEEEEEEAIRRQELKEFVDDEGVRWTRDRKRPPVNLLNHYHCTWKTRNNHFTRHGEVKGKEERRPTVNELANQKAVHQKASGWKVYHLAAQLEELMDVEKDVFSTISTVQEAIAPKHIAKHPTMEDDISMVHELTQGNIQRCQLVTDQLEEARSSMVKVLEHKAQIMEIINKHHSKRPVKKKERT